MASSNQIAIVTGAARPWGLGRRTALGLARKGLDIVVADIRDDWGRDAAEAITKETGRRATYVNTDITQRASVAAMVQRVEDEFGRIDVLANVAGVVINERVEAMTDETYDRVMDINLRGTFLTCQAVIPAMRRQSSGHIVNVSSGASVQPLKGLAAYAASKAGVNSFSRVLAWELARYGIVVTIVAPGRMVTNMGGEEGPEAEQFTAEVRGFPFLRAQHPDEVADVIVYAATNDNTALAGQTLHANGGTFMV
ncbi:MAG: SDR family oxidoreductase [Chloroflexi bacterium]|nr:SDR family oxidoreductase [Chloroflexota bacterium]